MNERIKWLWEQAGQRDDIMNTERHEKFAELIVQECMSSLYLNGYDDAMTVIQKHFKVEE
jgi:hypothetical protein